MAKGTDLGYFASEEPAAEAQDIAQHSKHEIILAAKAVVIAPEPPIATRTLKPTLAQIASLSKEATSEYSVRLIECFEQSGCFELVLAHFNGSLEHSLLLVLMINERVSNSRFEWTAIQGCFQDLLHTTIAHFESQGIKTKYHILTFLINCFSVLEIDFIRKECMRLVSISTWICLSGPNLAKQTNDEDLSRLWEKATKKHKSLKAEAMNKSDIERRFLSNFIQQLFKIIDEFKNSNDFSTDSLRFCERAFELMTDLLAQFGTRRHFNILLQDHLCIPRFQKSALMKHMLETQSYALLLQLFNRLKSYVTFPIDDLTGVSLSKDEVNQARHVRIGLVQKDCFLNFKEHMELFYFSSVGALDSPHACKALFSTFPAALIVEFCTSIGLRTVDFDNIPFSSLFLIECICWEFQSHPNQVERLNKEPLYPRETLLFDDSMVTTSLLNKSQTQPIPKLNLQYLTMYDCLVRNFRLYKLEASHTIRKEVEDACLRLSPSYNLDSEGVFDKTLFHGWSRMALPLTQVCID